MNMPKSREVHAKIPSPKAIFVGFLLVTVKILNSYMKCDCPAPEEPVFLLMRKLAPRAADIMPRS